ncbi:MAG: ATP-dependent DNA helicase RecG [Deltaproteobacteria bacterium]|nr:ATP-dependent DNA helicase RecG [Deltaproteobacteria bacterium]
MAVSPFRGALQALTAPLDFASRDDFAHAGRLPELEQSVSRACSLAKALAIPADLKRELSRIEADFGRPLDGEARVAAIRRALSRVEPWRGPGLCERMLARPLSVISGVGSKRAATLARAGLGSVADLLFRLPIRYDDRRALSIVGDLAVGERATFVARVTSMSTSGAHGGGRFRRIFEVVVGDDTGSVTLKWFRLGEAVRKSLDEGTWLLVSGEVKRFRFSKELIHPEIELLDAPPDGESAASAEGKGADALRSIVPDYSTPEGVNPRTLRRLIRNAVAEYADLLEGHLPKALVRERELPEPAEALRSVHAPELGAELEPYLAFTSAAGEDSPGRLSAAGKDMPGRLSAAGKDMPGRLSAAHERLVLEELFLLELGLVLRRRAQAALPGVPIDVGSERLRAAPESLPFRLTGAQERAWGEIQSDLARPHPMNRLLQGDVGSGKTAVALLAAVAVAGAGRQSALMAPTELLAEQHLQTFDALASGVPEVLGLRTALLTSSVPRAEAEAIRNALAAGEIELVVGTHALLREGVAFRDLALTIVDEQHRFGVLQRAALGRRSAAGPAPHVLLMTATPIPRTLALTAYGDLDVSVIDELPPGRRPVETLAFGEGEGRRIAELLRETAGRGEQVYVVYPLVEESEKLDLRSAMESAEKIAAAFPDWRVDIVHGRLDAAQRNAAMARFAAGETRILVSTTVIEVGVDIPGATLMIVEHAERFGLAQLHQLRGRVGRGERPGTCILVVRGRGRDAEARVSAMLESNDGFEIADADLRIRGPGEFLGTRQSGAVLDLRLADLVRDAQLVAAARAAALERVDADPGLAGDPHLQNAVVTRWGERLALANVG